MRKQQVIVRKDERERKSGSNVLGNEKRREM